MGKSITQIKHVIGFYAFLLVAWGFYRALFILPAEIEELVFKPLIWLVPTFWLVKKEGLGLSSVGLTGRNFWRSIYLTIGLGILFVAIAVFANTFKYGALTLTQKLVPYQLFVALGISLATAISEEITFRGFIFNRVWKASKNEVFANVLTTLGWGAIHLPVWIFVFVPLYGLTPADLLVRFFLTSIFGFGAAFIFARTQNIAAPVLLHVLWSWPIILFR